MSAYSDRVIADGALLYFRLDETSGPIARSAVAGWTGTISGGVTLNQAGALADGNKAIALDGTGKILGVQSFAIPAVFTLEAWTRTTAFVQQANIFSNRTPHDTSTFGWSIYESTASVYFDGGGWVRGARLLNDGAWHHLVATVDASAMCSLYCDGVIERAAPIIRAAPVIKAWALCHDPIAPTANFIGQCDEVVLYQSALTAQQIAAHYALAQPPPPPAKPYTTDIHKAVIAYLQADAELKALLPDGIWKDLAPAGRKRFAVVDVFEGFDQSVFGGRGIESVLYAVKATVLDRSGTSVADAADRIDDLLSEARLTIPGYDFMSCVREDDRPLIDYAEVNTTDAALLWRHMGFHYRVTVAVPRIARPPM